MPHIVFHCFIISKRTVEGHGTIAVEGCLDFSLQCCGSGMFIPDSGSWFLPIPDPGFQNSNSREGWKKINCYTFFAAINFTKLKIILFLKWWRKKIWANFKRIIELFTPKKLSLSSQKYGLGIQYPGSEIWDPGSGKPLFWIPVPDPQTKLFFIKV
jgi:hypothetical protein